jgi:hypothetical protein
LLKSQSPGNVGSDTPLVAIILLAINRYLYRTKKSFLPNYLLHPMLYTAMYQLFFLI